MLSYVKCKTGDKPPNNAVDGGFDDGPSYHATGVVNNLTIPGKVGVRSENDHLLVVPAFHTGQQNIGSTALKCLPWMTPQH